MRSIIQLAGRVWRHRPERECRVPNLLLFDTNIRHARVGDDGSAYCQPGFESNVDGYHLLSHRLSDILRLSERQAIDSRPRILPQPDGKFRPQGSLVDLEHFRLGRAMIPASDSATGLGAYTWWRLRRADAQMTGVIQQQQAFRKQTQQEIELCLAPVDEDPANGYLLTFVAEHRRGAPEQLIDIDRPKLERIEDTQLQGPRILPWMALDYMAELSKLANEYDISLAACAARFGKVSLPTSERGWRFHPALGYDRLR